MESNEKDSKIRELTDKVAFLSSIIIKAHKYAKDDPEVALTQARKSAEAICRNIFSAEIGEPGKIMLDELIKKLAERKLLPTKILVPLGTIQAYGNYGTHAQSATENIDFNYITPCLSALAQVSSWYFTEYLKTSIPADLAAEEVKDAKSAAAHTPATATAEKRSLSQSTGAEPKSSGQKKSILWIAIGAAVVAVIIAVILMTGRQGPEGTGPGASADTLKSAATTSMGTQTQAKDSASTLTQKQEGPSSTTTEAVKEKETAPKETGRGTAVSHTTTGKEASEAKDKNPPAIETAAQTPAKADVDPTVLKEYPPVYPASMKGSNVSGEVRVRVYVDAKGNPTEARILSYDDERLQQAAIDAAMHYKFNPGLAAGKPVPAWATVRIQFNSN